VRLVEENNSGVLLSPNTRMGGKVMLDASPSFFVTLPKIFYRTLAIANAYVHYFYNSYT
jgi:hypothetical protein